MASKKIPLGLLIPCITLILSCGSLKPYYDKKYKDWETSHPSDTATLLHSVFLVGDAGLPRRDKMEPSLKLLRNQIYDKIDTLLSNVADTASNTFCTDTSIFCISVPNTNKSVIFLGDNIYYEGMPEEDHPDRLEMERRIRAQLDVVKDFKGNKFFVPGNHDWNEMKPDGLATLKRQEDFVEAYLDSQDVFLPSGGCPGPVEIQAGTDVVIILIDSEWWLYRHYKPLGPENGCYVNGKFDLIVQLEDIIQRNRGKHILIAQHHPLISNGNHGGFYSFKDYMFPLTLIRPNLYIPLPILGSIYPLMRQYGISREDIGNPLYQQMISAIRSVIDEEKNITFAAGHEHNLQLSKSKELYHIVSGSACKDKHVVRGRDAIYTHETRGFAKVNYYSNGEAWVEFWTPEGDGTTGKCTFRSPLYAITKKKEVIAREDFACVDSTKIMSAEPEYKASKPIEYLFGKHYRKEWSTPFKVHFLDLNCVGEGLTPIKKGGGMQTTSLRLVAKDSTQYTLRSINKDPASLLPEGLRKTFAEDFLQDQMSSAHPYGPMAIPGMAKALGIYHIQPDLYYVPHSPLLGPYIDEMGGKLAYLEIRPDEDLSKFKEFGRTNNAISTRTLFEKKLKDNKNKVDQRNFLKARLFDMIIGDWDRHKDQWRWAEFETKEGSIFKPIPRDRDQAFSKFDGLIPSMIAGKTHRNLNTFSPDFHDLIGLNLSGSILDRTLLTELTLNDWIQIADSVKTLLTDEVIEKSVKKMPPEIFAISGQEMINNIKSRRDRLILAATEYYLVVSKTVEIAASDKSESINVERLNDLQTRVVIYDKDKEGKADTKIYDRTFKTNETEEIQIFALKGDDTFTLTGDVDKGIKIRFIGGEGKDSITDHSSVKGLSKKTVIYDQKKEDNYLNIGKETKNRLSKKKSVHEYDTPEQLYYRYNKTGPKFNIEFNEDDGLFIGGGLSRKTYGFRKDPAKSEHAFIANYASRTGAFNVRYKADYYSLFGKNWDLSFNSKWLGPNFALNYFGQGNNTEFTIKNIDFYRARIEKIEVTPYVNNRITDYFTAGIAPSFEYYDVHTKPNTYLAKDEFPDKSDIVSSSYFGGVKLFSDINLLDNKKNPKRGAIWRNEINYVHEFRSGFTEFTNLNTDLAFFITPNTPLNLTIALRVGGATNIGEYKFYQSNFLGGRTNLRGFRNTRYAGRSSFYQNTEFRFRMFDHRGYIFTGNWGLLAFLDQGRVWADNENSRNWHMGYGPGIWIDMYNVFLISASYGFSREDYSLRLHLGFFF